MRLTLTQEKFFHKYCQIFAQVAHAETGGRIIDFFDQNGKFLHCVVKIGKNKYIDASGIHTMAKIRRFWYGDMSANWKIRSKARTTINLWNWVKKKNFIQNIIEAHRLFRRMYGVKIQNH